ncbi:Uncharacterised protein [Klebsiella variicola]|uniref:Uncharacterized protein n=1 Tax=Klebsiella variicola TaxID=244366 RepID=A0A7H4M7H0_KLEVA|nr:Uncharacterised protein [Klebsiella variicola]
MGKTAVFGSDKGGVGKNDYCDEHGIDVSQ